MENATKALLMAGGVLISIIVISLLVRTYGNIGQFKRQQLSAEEAERIEEYNKEYTKYLNQYVYGTELITVINNTVYASQKNEVAITLKIKFTVDTYTYTRKYIKNGIKKEVTKTVKKGGEFTLNTETDEIDTFEEFIDAKNDDGSTNENVEQLKNRAFKCDEIKYDNNTGKVNYIHFTEVNYQIQSNDW